MNKAILIILSGFTVALVITVVLVQKPKTPVSPVSNSQPSPTKIPTVLTKLKTYNDPSGFSLKYPETYTLTEKKIRGSVNLCLDLTYRSKNKGNNFSKVRKF